MARILLERPGIGVVLRHDLSGGPLRLGRAPGNELQLGHPGVSAFHAVIVEMDGGPAVLDLRSSNGTHVNGQRVERHRLLADGDVLTLGRDMALVVSLRASPTSAPLVVEDRASGLVLPPGVALAGLDLQEVRATDSGRYVVRIGGDEVDVELGVPFTWRDRALTLRPADPGATTWREGRGGFPYEVVASLDGPVGPEARVRDRVRGVECALASENRAVLVYLLARQLLQDRARAAGDRLPGAQERVDRGGDAKAGGWCADDALRRGIWGASWREQAPNNLNVLIRRTRAELEAAGLDAQCIQKIPGYARLCVDEVVVR